MFIMRLQTIATALHTNKEVNKYMYKFVLPAFHISDREFMMLILGLYYTSTLSVVLNVVGQAIC